MRASGMLTFHILYHDRRNTQRISRFLRISDLFVLVFLFTHTISKSEGGEVAGPYVGLHDFVHLDGISFVLNLKTHSYTPSLLSSYYSKLNIYSK